ncbi:Mu transposase C-terminal domain-containing protein, partial [Rhodococcus yananensis]|uniref:Mu transposase C-terminal domain-containing protein n=1 Tax=Rhodococcus yananensis TaxID=2879464 RepID=UPI001CF8D0BD
AGSWRASTAILVARSFSSTLYFRGAAMLSILHRFESLRQTRGDSLLTVATARVVRRDGVHFQGLRYVSPLLAAYVKEQVVIRYDPRDISEIHVFHKNQYICKAVDPDHASSTVSLKEIQEARNERRRQLRSQIKERIAVVVDPSPPASAPAPEPARTKKPRLRTYLEDD